jgi:hypothetical protein
MRSPYYINQEGNPAVLSTKKAIEHALYEEGVSLTIPDEYTGITGFYEDNLKINKLAYAVIDQYNMPAVRTWYKYGQYEPYDILRPTAFDIGPVSGLGEYVYTNWQMDITVGDLVETLQEFDLSSIFEMDMFEFLKNNYENWASDEFKNIYLASTKIIQVLEEFKVASLDDINEKISDWRRNIKEASIDMRYLIQDLDCFSTTTVERIGEFLTLLEDALISVETGSESLTEDKYKTLFGARETYHEFVWPFAAMSISLQEIDGPENEIDEYNSRGQDIRTELERRSKTHLKGWKRELEEENLLPTIDQRQSVVQASRDVGNLVDSGILRTE